MNCSKTWHVCLLTIVIGLFLFSTTASYADGTKFLPADAEFILTINVRHMLDSKLVKDNKAAVDQLRKQMDDFMSKDAGAAKLFKAMGVDPLRDLSSFSIAFNSSIDPNKGLIVVEGNFDVERFRNASAEAVRQYPGVVSSVKVGQHDALEISPPNENTLFIALADKNTLVGAASKAALEKAFNQTNAQPVQMNPNMQALLQSVGPKQSAYFVATNTALENALKKGNNPQAMMAAGMLNKISGLSGGVTFAENIQFQLGIGTKNQEAAKEMSEQAAGALLMLGGLVAKQAENNPQMQPLVDIARTLRTSTQGPALIIRGEVSPQNLEKLLQSLENLQQ